MKKVKKINKLQWLFAIAGVIIGGSVDLRIPLAIIAFQCVHLLSHE
jgi:hypothetical protein